jgi:outer membrane protein assembly factor BamD (BamD/ComL family)
VFINKFPVSKHVPEAREKLDQLAKNNFVQSPLQIAQRASFA